MPNYNGLTRNQWPGTWSPSSNHPIALDTEIRGGLRYVSGVDSDTVTGIHGQRLQDGMVVYVKNAHGGFEADRYYKYQLGVGEHRDSNTGELPNASSNWAPFQLDSAGTIALIDSDYIQARQKDSAGTATLALDANKLGGQLPSHYLDFNNITNPPAILDGVDVSNIIVADVDKAFVDALAINADKLDGLDRQQFLRADQSDSMVGSLHIDSNLVVGGYIAGPETFFIDPNTVGDNTGKVVIKGDLQVDGTQTTVNSTTVTINDKNIVLADSASDSAEADGAGITVNGANATITYSATSDKWEFNKDIAAGNINATLAGSYTGFDSDFDVRLATKTTTDVAEGTNLYYTTARHDSDTLVQVDSSYVQARQTPQDFAYSSLTGAPTNVSSFVNDANYLDSTTVQGVVTANYIDGLVNLNYLDSAEVIQLVDSAYVQAREGDKTFGLAANTGSHTFNPETETLTFLGTTGQINAGIAANNVTLELDQNINSITSIAFEGDSTNAFETKVQAVNPTADNVVNLPDSSGTIALMSDVTNAQIYYNTSDFTDSAFVTGLPVSTFDNDKKYLDSNSATAFIDSAYVQLRSPPTDLSAVGQHIVPATGSLYDLGDSNSFWRDLYLSGSTIVLGDLKLAQHTGRLRITNRHNGDEIKLAAENIGDHKVDSSVVTSLASALPVSTFGNDANYLDSVTVKGVIDSAYIATAMETDSNITVTIVQNITDTVDSAYVLGRVAEAPFLDSYYTTALVDAAYVQARQTAQDFAYSSLTGKPTIPSFGNDFVDSATVLDIVNSAGLDSDLVIALVDSAYIQLRDRFQDSSLVTSTVDATYVQTRQIQYNTSDFLDSNTVSLVIDSAYIAARVSGADSAINASEALNADQLDGQHGTYYLDYNNFSNTPTIPNVNTAYVNALNVDADTLDGQHGSYYLNYSNLTGKPTVLTTTDVKNIFNSTGDDEISTGAVVDLKYLEFPHDGGTQHTYSVEVVSKTSAHRYQGQGSSNGYQIDGVESPFLQFVPGNTYRFDQSNGTNGTHQIRFYYDAAKTTAYTTGVTLNGNAGQAGSYTEIVISESTPPVLYYQCVNHGYMGNAVFTQTRNLTGFTTDNLTQGTSNLYYSNASVTSHVDSNYIQNRTRIGLGDIDFGSNKILYANIYATTGDLPSASTYHGMFAHVHGTGKGYFAHGGNWIELIDDNTFGTKAQSGSLTIDGNGSTGGVTISDGGVAIKTGTGNVAAVDFYCEVNNAHRVRLKSPAHANFSGNPDVTLPNTSGTIALTSDITTSINNVVDSAYVQARQTSGGGGTVDSADIIAIVDSAYVTARFSGSGISLATARQGISVTTGGASGGGALSYDNSTGVLTFNPSTNTGGGGGGGSTADGITLSKFVYTADSGQVTFTDSDDTGTVLAYNTADTQINVYLNGILLVDSDDFTLTDSSTVTLTSATNLNDRVQIIKYTPPSGGGGGSGTVDSANIVSIIDSDYVQARTSVNARGTLEVNKFFFDATAGQVLFQGDDKFGSTLTIDPSNAEVYLNGILQEETTDYALLTDRITFSDALDSGYAVTIIETIGRVNSRQTLNETSFEFTADSGDTVFSGTDNNGRTLDLTTGAIQVYLNGILLSETNDYTKTNSAVTLLQAADSADFMSVVVTSANVASSLNTKQFHFAGHAGKTLTGNGLGFSGGVQIFKNDVLLDERTDYVTTLGNKIILTDSAIVTDQITVQTFNAQEFSGKTFDFVANNGQTIFSGDDRYGEPLLYQQSGLVVYLNGIALVDSVDYVATDGNRVTFNTPVSASDEVKISTFMPADLSSVATPLTFDTFEYIASGGQSHFSGTDLNGQTLAYSTGLVNVYLNGLLLRTEDFKDSSGSVLTLTDAADSGDNLTITKLTGNNIGIDAAEAQGLITTRLATNPRTWIERTSGTPITSGSRNIVDTSTVSVTLTLPQNANFGDEIRVIDGTGNASTNNITINRNGHRIQGGTTDLVIDVDRAGIGLVYYNAANGWILIEN